MTIQGDGVSLSTHIGKKGAHPIMAVMLGGVVIFVGIYATQLIINSISMPTVTVAESLTFTNLTYTSVSYPYISSVSSIKNSTHTVGTGNYTWSSTGINLTARCSGGDTGIDLSLPYTTSYTYNLQEGNDTFASTQSTFWSSMNLGAVSLITLAASLVLGSFFFG